MHRYRILCARLRSPEAERFDSRSAVVMLLDSLSVHRNEYKMGKTKLFIRSPKTIVGMEEAREAMLPKFVSLLQRWYRRRRIQYFLRVLCKTYDGIRTQPDFGKSIVAPKPMFATVRAFAEFIPRIQRNYWAKMFVKRLPAT